MAGWDDHLHPLGEQWPEAWSRLHNRIPVLGLLMAAPVERTEIVDHAQMRRRGEVGEAETGSGEPAAVVEQIIEIVEMLGRGPHRLAEDARVGALAIDQSLSHPLVHQRLDRLPIKLDIEPFGHAPDLGAKRGIAVDHRHSIHGLIKIFDHWLRADKSDPL